MSDFPQVLERILSIDRATRESGEQALTSLIQHSPDQAAHLLSLAMSSPNDNHSALAAVLFRRKILEEGVVSVLSPDLKTGIKTALLQVPQSSKSIQHLRQLADVLVNFAETEGWANDLMRHMGAWIQEPSPVIKEFTLYLFELSTDCSMNAILKGNASAVITLLTDAINDADSGVQLSAVKTTASFLAILDTDQEVNSFVSVGPLLLNSLTRALQQDPMQVCKLKDALRNLADLTEMHPRFWKSCADEFCRVLTTLAKSSYFYKELRGAASELLSTLLTKAPAIIKKSLFFTQELIVLALTMTSEVGESGLEEWVSEDVDESVVSNEPYSLGKDLMSRLAVYLGSQTVLPHFQQLIPLHLRSDDWVKQHTGILAIGMIAEGCHSAFESSLGDVLGMVLPFLSSQNPRLIWAAITTLGLLCTEFEPVAQFKYHQEIVPGLIQSLQHDCLKVQSQATSALVNFTRGLLADDSETAGRQCIEPYAAVLLQSLVSLLQRGLEKSYYPLLEKVLNAVSALASVLDTAFAQYYNLFIPGLRTLIGYPAVSQAQKEVRAQCIRALGYMVESVAEAGPAFIEDANSLFISLLQQRSDQLDSDPATAALEEMSPSFANTLKDRFAPFLPSIVPGILAKAAGTVKIEFFDEASLEGIRSKEKLQSIKLDMRGHGMQQLAIDTNAIDAKNRACMTLCHLVRTMKTLYAPMILPTVNTLVPLMTCNISSRVRKCSVKALAYCVDAGENQQTKEAILRQLFPAFQAVLEESVEVHPSDTKALLKGLNIMLEAVDSPAVIGLPAAIDMSKVLADAVGHVFNRKVARVMERNNGSGEDDLEDLESDEELDDEIIRRIMEVVGAMLKAFKVQYQSVFKQYFLNFYEALFAKPNPSDIETLSAICIFDDYMEYTRDLMIINNQLPVLEKFLSFTNHSDSSIRQSSIFGVGLCAELSPPALFSLYAQRAVQACSSLICAPDARSQERIELTECAVGALGKIALIHCPEMVENWLGCLPLRSEPQEAQAINKLFLTHYPRLQSYGSKAQRVVSDLQELVRIRPEVLDAEGVQLLLRETSNSAGF